MEEVDTRASLSYRRAWVLMTTPDKLRIRIRREIAKSVKGAIVLVSYTMYVHYEIIRILIQRGIL